jgi:DNA mismatch endonuclease, patch repair protein
MADVHNRVTRSYNMSRVKSKDTKPEMLVRHFLHGKGFRYKLHDKSLPGRPDLVLPKYKTVIFIHGCFWHGHAGCKYSGMPKTRTEWWMEKIATNITHDKRAMELLEEAGWTIVTIWGCELKPKQTALTLERLLRVFLQRF